MMGNEVEAKFHVSDLGKIVVRLEALEAELLHPRMLEQNWRYDTQDCDLEAEWQILRLRSSHKKVITFKGRATEVDGTSQRPEYEIEVDDLDQARLLLGALGYQVSGFYEKYRTEYTLDGLLITLDEMPFGDFVEIEGASITAIQQAALDLGLTWEAGITENYLVLFNRMKQVLGLKIDEMSFDALSKVEANPPLWGIKPADI